MSNERYDSLSSLDSGTYDWKVKVRISRKWNSVHKATGELRGYNMILVDDQASRKHAFVGEAYMKKFEDSLIEGRIYVIENFNVKPYTEKEKHQCFKDDMHIFFSSYTHETIVEKDDKLIPENVFGFYDILELGDIANQNVFLIDVIGYAENVENPRHFTNKNNEAQSYVKFDLSDGCYKEPGFSSTQRTVRIEAPVPKIKVAELKNFIPENDEMNVLCDVTIMKIRDKESWFFSICCGCSEEIEKVDADETGGIGIVLYDREVRRLIGKTVFEIQWEEMQNGATDQFPTALMVLENITCTITLGLKKAQSANKTNIFHAVDIMLNLSTECNSPSSQGDTYIQQQASVTLGSVSQVTKPRSKKTPDTLKSTSKSKGKKKSIKMETEINLSDDEDTEHIHLSNDVVGTVRSAQILKRYIDKNGNEQSFVRFVLANNDDTTVSVTFWNNLANSFMAQTEGFEPYPITILISSCKVLMHRGSPTLTNLHATRFYVNPNLPSPSMLLNGAEDFAVI
ncbi:hypothetical protein ACET3Z_018309 [Daucus carota]